jgi:hypothetical protein
MSAYSQKLPLFVGGSGSFQRIISFTEVLDLCGDQFLELP